MTDIFGIGNPEPNNLSQESNWTMVLPKRTESNLAQTSVKLSTTTKTLKRVKTNKNLFVGGLAWQTTEHSVHAYFQRFGPLEKVVVMHGRGFGFVLFKHSNDAEGVLKHTDPHVVDKKIVE
jgi:RNA recognition motif-containing protein